MCATVRDLARVGRLIAQGGARGSAQIVPEAWIDDITEKGDRDAWVAGDLAPYFPGEPIRYRSQWYVHGRKVPVLFCLGIHGQHLWVHRTRDIVIAKVSSRASPLDAERGWLTTSAVSRIIDFLIASSG
jgi:CubicO group peptidase (beta-lactamase class C family)